MQKELTKKYLINGPNNVVRLSNKEKVLYIFGDYHLDTDIQNECLYNDDYDSLEIDKLILKFMKREKNRQFDLFAEYDDDNNLSIENNYSKDIYIRNIIKLFQSKIKESNNKIKINKKFPNFRFHFMDIRNTFNYKDVSFKDMAFFDFNITTETDNFVKKIKKIKYKIELFYSYINNNDNKYITKILNKYKNIDIQKKIKFIFNNTVNELKKLVKEIDDLYNFVDKNILIYSDYLFTFENSQKINNKLEKFNDTYNIILVVFTDLYFLRRFLDKSYITNGILYIGKFHMNDIAYLLVKYFDYEITDIFVCDPKFEIKSEIKKLKFENFEYLYILEQYTTGRLPNLQISQCVNLHRFPANFS